MDPACFDDDKDRSSTVGAMEDIKPQELSWFNCRMKRFELTLTKTRTSKTRKMPTMESRIHLVAYLLLEEEEELVPVAFLLIVAGWTLLLVSLSLLYGSLWLH